MNRLHRELAPISEGAWTDIDEHAARTLRQFLAARKLVDFSGPHGWHHTAVATGRVDSVDAPSAGMEARTRRARPVAELRTPFEISRAEVEAFDRGAPDPDWDPVVDAARRAALAEDRAVFHGWDAAGIDGIAAASPHQALVIGDDYSRYPSTVAMAVARLRDAAVDGPYGLALGPRCFTGVIETSEFGGYPVLEHLRLIVGGPVVWAPGIDGAIVVSMRGDDFSLSIGADFAVGYTDHDADHVQLFVEESFTFTAAGPEAGIALVYED